MPDNLTHMLTSAAAATAVSHLDNNENATPIEHTIITSLVGAWGGKLPDILEPALHPNHRQFYHSLAVLSLIGITIHKIWKMQPEGEPGKLLRLCSLALLSGYACHLIMDGTTPKSLPLLGKLS